MMAGKSASCAAVNTWEKQRQFLELLPLAGPKALSIVEQHVELGPWAQLAKAEEIALGWQSATGTAGRLSMVIRGVLKDVVAALV